MYNVMMIKIKMEPRQTIRFLWRPLTVLYRCHLVWSLTQLVRQKDLITCLRLLFHFQVKIIIVFQNETKTEQEYIPGGCVPSAAVAVSPATHPPVDTQGGVS